MKKLISAACSFCLMLSFPLFARADIPALPPDNTHSNRLVIILVAAFILIDLVILVRFLRTHK